MNTRSTRKVIALVSPNILPPEDTQLDADTLREILKTYAQVKRLDDLNTEDTSVTSFEVSEHFYTFIRNKYILAHGVLTLVAHAAHDEDTGTDYLCLSTAQFKHYLAAYKAALDDARYAQVEYLNALTEEIATLKPLLSLLDVS